MHRDVGKLTMATFTPEIPGDDRPPLRVKERTRGKNFSCETIQALEKHYEGGMWGTGRKYESRILAAARETGLTPVQVTVSFIC